MTARAVTHRQSIRLVVAALALEVVGVCCCLLAAGGDCVLHHLAQTLSLVLEELRVRGISLRGDLHTGQIGDRGKDRQSMPWVREVLGARIASVAVLD